MVETSSQEGGVDIRRRQIRKGTQSCWECKRRKVRCIFVSNHSTCNNCRRRGTTCISQEYPDKPGLPHGDQLESRLTRIEDALEQLMVIAGTAHHGPSASEHRLGSHFTSESRENREIPRQYIDRAVSLDKLLFYAHD